MTTTKFVQCALLAALFAPLAGYAADRQLKEESKQFSDGAVTARIKAELAKSHELDASGIQVRSARGRVTLTGVAQSQDAADRAAALVRGVKGVVTVQNDIKVSGVGATR
jgi:osmotically-inducible protein OsmY